MTPTAAGSTLLDRMVARVAEPFFTQAPSLPAPAAWGEEIAEQAALVPPPVVESRRPDPAQQAEPPQPVDDFVPQIVTRVREVPSVASVAPLPRPDVHPAAKIPVFMPQRAEAPEERNVAVPQRSEIRLRETTVFVPAPAGAPQPPPRALRGSPAVHSAAPAKMQLNLAMPPPEARPAGVQAPVSIPVSAVKRAASPAVQPDLPVPISSPVNSTPVVIQAEPVIHVTIGRLEVRTPERERKPRPVERGAPASGATLEQYLAKRRGGGVS